MNHEVEHTQYGIPTGTRNGYIELTYPVYGIRFEDPDVAVLARKVLKVSTLMAVLITRFLLCNVCKPNDFFRSLTV